MHLHASIIFLAELLRAVSARAEAHTFENLVIDLKILVVRTSLCHLHCACAS